MISRRFLLFVAAAFGVLGSISAPAPADDAGLLSAGEALEKAESGEVMLVDVRSPQEWSQTGVPANSHQVTIHNVDGLEGFVAAMTAEVEGDRSRPVALICARGNRSTLAQQALKQAGFTNVLNVREGMLGSNDGPGWLARSLPTDPCRTC